MALIVEQHVVADMYPVGDTAISAGMLVAMNPAGDGDIIPATSALDDSVIGIAGDSAVTSGQTTAYSSEVVIGADDSDTARSRWTSNRVSDMYNETLASGKITVYNGGGKFWISSDLVDSPTGVAPGDGLAAATGGKWVEVADNSGGVQVALCVGKPALYPSGVPGAGTDAINGSTALGNSSDSNNWVPISLRI